MRIGRRSYILYLFLFSFRMGDECILSCPLNYENKSEKTNKGYICTPKQCGDRMPWSNRTCSMKEDFPANGGDGGEVLECAFSRVGDDGVENCVLGENCPAGYSKVLYLSQFSFISVYVMYIHFFFLAETFWRRNWK
jgi:hypothetical protein